MFGEMPEIHQYWRKMELDSIEAEEAPKAP
jgi:hypothetical protein